MMNTRSKTRTQTVSSNTSPASNPKSQVNQVISQTNSSPLVTSPQDKRSPFSSPFARPQSFMRNVLSRVSNQNNVQLSSAPHTAPALIEQSQSSLSHSNEKTIAMEPVSIKKETPSPRKLSPTPEDSFAHLTIPLLLQLPSSTRKLIQISENQKQSRNPTHRKNSFRQFHPSNSLQ